MRYRCDICGCYLDPGEGSMCEECREERRRKADRDRRIREVLYAAPNGQYEMKMEGMER